VVESNPLNMDIILLQFPVHVHIHAPPLFGSKSTISRFGERFHGGQYNLVRFLFAIPLLTVPPCQDISKSVWGAGAPWSRCHW